MKFKRFLKTRGNYFHVATTVKTFDPTTMTFVFEKGVSYVGNKNNRKRTAKFLIKEYGFTKKYARRLADEEYSKAENQGVFEDDAS